MVSQKNKSKIIMAVCAAVALAIFVWVGVFAITYYPGRVKDSNEYLEIVKALDYYDNEFEDAIPQIALNNIIANHFENNDSGKTPKVLFIGYDGCQAVMPGLNFGSEDSAITKVAQEGGMYLTYAGGAKIGDQDTSTAPGWAAIFTGVWATENGVFGNGIPLNTKTRSIIFELGSKGLATSYSVSWAPHISRTYKKEVATAADQGYPITYLLNKDDEGTYLSMAERIQAGDRAVFGILEYCDHNGHFSGFSIDSEKYVEAYYESEEKAMSLIQTVESRDTYQQEDWLIIITTDHGGYQRNHGGTTSLERYTFLAINKSIQ